MSTCPIYKRAKPHAVYRVWGCAGELLYIGCSMSPLNRVMVHTQRKQWATQVRSVTVEWFADWQTAINAERDAIKAERPVWNTKHNIQSISDANAAVSA